MELLELPWREPPSGSQEIQGGFVWDNMGYIIWFKMDLYGSIWWKIPIPRSFLNTPLLNGPNGMWKFPLLNHGLVERVCLVLGGWDCRETHLQWPWLPSIPPLRVNWLTDAKKTTRMFIGGTGHFLDTSWTTSQASSSHNSKYFVASQLAWDGAWHLRIFETICRFPRSVAQPISVKQPANVVVGRLVPSDRRTVVVCRCDMQRSCQRHVYICLLENHQEKKHDVRYTPYESSSNTDREDTLQIIPDSCLADLSHVPAYHTQICQRPRI